MERNWDTVRELLLATAALEPSKDLTLGDYPKERAHEVSYHVQMLTNAGMLDATISQTLSRDAKHFFVRSLTWEGNEFLDSIREKNVWERTKSTISEQGGAMTLGIIQAVATGIAKNAMGL